MWVICLTILAAYSGVNGLDDRPREAKQLAEPKKYDVELSFPVEGENGQNRADASLIKNIEELINQIIRESPDLTVNDTLPGTHIDKSSIFFDTSYQCGDGEVVRDDQCVPCPPGTYFDEARAVCEKCAVGYFNGKSAQRACIKCPSIGDEGITGVTVSIGSTSQTDCKQSCKPGNYFDETTGLCRKCEHGLYQPEAGQFECEQCGLGLTTRTRAATSKDECRAECGDGQQLNIEGDCEVCPVGSYRKQGKKNERSCKTCPPNLTTEKAGSTSEADCVKPKCYPGQYLKKKGDDYECELCSIGEYQPKAEQTTCLSCPADTSTVKRGATSESQCSNRCTDGDQQLCDDHALCLFKPQTNDYTCECKLGYQGNETSARNRGGCTNMCDGFCRNEGTCVGPKTKGGQPYCQCVGSFTGKKCEEKSNFAYMAGGIAGAVIFVIILVLLIWMICVRATRSRKPSEKNMMPASGELNGSQVNFYYGQPAPYAESIAPSQHGSTYAHYYEDEEEGWGMPNFYDTYGKNSKMARSNGSLYNAGMYGPGVYGPQYAPQGELYDRLGRHAYHPRPEDKSGDNDTTSESDDSQSRRQ